MGNKIKKTSIDKIYKMMLSRVSKGYFIDIARSAIGEYCVDLSEDEINEHLESCKEKLDSYIRNSPDVDKKFKIILDEPLSLQIYRNDEYKLLKLFKQLDGAKFEDMIVIILKRMGLKKIKTNRGGKGNDSLCVDIEAEYLGPIFSCLLYIQAKWKEDEKTQINLNDLKSYIGGVSQVIHKQSANKGKYYTNSLIYVTSALFAEDAIEYANNMGVKCIDGLTLAKIIIQYNLTKQLYDLIKLNF